jgi:hypothetical protein
MAAMADAPQAVPQPAEDAPPPKAAEEDAVLVYTPGSWRRTARQSIIFVLCAGALYLFLRGCGLAAVWSVPPAMILAGVVAAFLPRPHRVVVKKDSIRIGWREIPYDSIKRIARPPYRFAADQVALRLKQPASPSILWHLFGVSLVALRGDRLFQARVIEQIHRRRHSVPVESGVYQAFSARDENPKSAAPIAVVAFMLTAAAWACLLFLSLWGLAAPPGLHLVPFLACLLTVSAQSVERESPRKAVLLALFAAASPAVFMLWVLGVVDGFLAHLPPFYTFAMLCAIAGVPAIFLTSLPPRRYLAIAGGVCALCIAAVWTAVLVNVTGPRTTYVWPSPHAVAFSPGDEKVFVSHASEEARYDGRRATHAIDPHDLTVRLVHARRRRARMVAPVSDDAALFLVPAGESGGALAIGGVGERWDDAGFSKALVDSSLVVNARGTHAAFLERTAEAGDDGKRRLKLVDLETRSVTDAEIDLPADAIGPRWRADARLAWLEYRARTGAEAAGGEGKARPFAVMTWAPGEEGPRQEAGPSDACLVASCSKDFDALRVRQDFDGKETHLLLRTSGGTTFTLRTGVRIHASSAEGGPGVPAEAWSADGETYAYVPDDAPGVVRVIEIMRQQERDVFRARIGVVGTLSLSPDGSRVAFWLVEGSSRAAALYVCHTREYGVRRVGPLLSWNDAHARRKSLAWSSGGSTLAVATSCHPLTTWFSHGGGAVWIVEF